MGCNLDRKSILYIVGMPLALAISTISLSYLVANLRISTTVATKIIGIIGAYSTVATIISLASSVIVGCGVLTINFILENFS